VLAIRPTPAHQTTLNHYSGWRDFLDKLRILIGDDHTLMRQGLRKILEDRSGWEIVAEAGDGRAAVSEAFALRPDVVVLDIGMPLLNGIEATFQITHKLPHVSILILSMHADEAYVTQAVRAGARGYLLKDSAGVDLIDAIAAVAAGKSFFSPPIAKVVLDGYARRLAESVLDRYDTLSPREREIFQLVAEGYSTKEIADLLSISPATVETHRAHILRKLDIHNTAELVRYAVRRGVVS
jgi:two-component system, NarL family, response regulator NreC